MAAPKLVPRLDLEEGETLLDYLLHPDKLAGVLTQLRDLQAGLDAKIAGLGTLQEADALRDQAAVARDEAAHLRRLASDGLDAARVEAAAVREEGQQAKHQAEDEAAAMRRATATERTQLGAWESNLVTRAQVMDGRQRECERREAVAQVAQEAADTLLRDLEQKLDAFQAMMRKG